MFDKLFKIVLAKLFAPSALFIKSITLKKYKPKNYIHMRWTIQLL